MSVKSCFNLNFRIKYPMVDNGRHLGAVPDLETHSGNKGLVTVRTAGIGELRRWLRRPTHLDEASFAPITLPEIIKPTCTVTGTIEKFGSTATILTSWIKPVDNRTSLPADLSIKSAVATNLLDYKPDWTDTHSLTLNTESGSSHLEIKPDRYSIVTDFITDYEELLAERFSTHASILQGLIEALLTAQTDRPNPAQKLDFTLRPLLGNGSGPRPTRAA